MASATVRASAAKLRFPYRTRRRPPSAGSRSILSGTLLVLLALAAICALASAGSADPINKDEFKESLDLRPLADGRLYAHFAFDLESPDRRSATPDGHQREVFGIVPRSLIHMARASDAQELHLAINAGRWDYVRWGQPKGDDMVGNGAELWAKVRRGPSNSSQPSNSIDAQALSNWRRLAADLAGLFCASLDALDEKVTVEPLDASSGRGHSDEDLMSLEAALASESICTENLSTLLKLLPCKTQSGLASLLDVHHFFAADFHGMAVHLVRSGDQWKVKINVQAVFSPVLQPRERRARNWSFKDIFGRAMEESCPIASESSVTVHAPPDGSTPSDVTPDNVEFSLWPIVMLPSESREVDDDDDLSSSEKLRIKGRMFAANVRRNGHYTYNTMSSTNLDVQMLWPGQNEFRFPQSYQHPTITAARVLSGYGQERGVVEANVRNQDHARERYCTYEEVLPWFIKPYLHTLRATTISEDYDEDEDNVVRFADDLLLPPLVSLNYTPSIPRARPFHLLARLRIPPQSTVRLTFDYDKAFLRYAEHPPDAHRGFDIAPAVVTVDGEEGRTPQRLYTDPALVEVAVPDFSMPYNVM